LKREAIEEFGERRNIENLGDAGKKSVLDILRRDPNAMNVDKHREIRKYYNCGKTGHLTARCSKPRKVRSEKVRIVDGVKENFS